MSRSTAFRAAPARVATMDPRQNRLLAALPPAQWAEWAPRIEHLDFPLGHVVHEPGDPYHYVYFPLTTVISIMRTLSTGASTQLAVVGHEGLLGVPVFIGGGPAGNRAVVQHAGAAVRIEAAFIRAAFENTSDVMHLLLRYTQTLLVQMAQIGICNTHHTPEQQMCRYLLMSLDRMQGHDLTVTHEVIGGMLGLRRETVTETIRKLQGQGAIFSRRGHIQVPARGMLESRACECYATVRRECDRLLP